MLDLECFRMGGMAEKSGSLVHGVYEIKKIARITKMNYTEKTIPAKKHQ